MEDKDENQFLKDLMNDKLKHVSERKLEEISNLLIEDISNYHFDFTSDSTKIENLFNKFIEIAKNLKDDEIPACSDVYWIHEKMMQLFNSESREKDGFSMIFEMSDDERTRDVSLLNECLAGRYIMKNWSDVNKATIDQVFTDVAYKNVRNFMNGVIQHNSFPITNIPDEINYSLILHKCAEEKLIFLLDHFFPRLQSLSNNQLEEIFEYKDVNGNNVFHHACSNRIKFVVEELWNLILRVYGEKDGKKLNNYLLTKNNDDKNVFQLAFQMPFTYNNSDYANEIKAKDQLLYYYRVRGPLELEIYNFESCLNFIFDIGRRHILDKFRRSLIFDYKSKKGNFHRTYSYSRDFSDFRYEFLQLRYYCITKLSLIKTENLEKASMAYMFLSHYVENLLSLQDENKLMEIYQKLSYGSFMEDFFKVFVRNYFMQAIKTVGQVDNVKTLFYLTRKVLNEEEFTKTLLERGVNGNNLLQQSIMYNNFNLFNLTFEQFKEKSSIIRMITSKNNDEQNSLYMLANSNSINMLNVFFNYFSNNLNEDELMEIFEGSTKKNYKFLDIFMLYYNPVVLNLVIKFIEVHLSPDNFKKLIGESIIVLAVSKWQEGATTTVLDLIANLFSEDEGEIKRLLFGKNWEGQTAFHAASKNYCLNQLQTLCKFAHAFLSKEDFIELISSVDANEFSM